MRPTVLASCSLVEGKHGRRKTSELTSSMSECHKITYAHMDEGLAGMPWGDEGL